MAIQPPRARKSVRKTPVRRLRRIVVIEGAKVVELSSDDIWLLKELMVAGEIGRTINSPATGPLTRLANAGYVKIKKGNVKSTVFVISERGLQALVDVTGNDP